MARAHRLNAAPIVVGRDGHAASWLVECNQTALLLDHRGLVCSSALECSGCACWSAEELEGLSGRARTGVLSIVVEPFSIMTLLLGHEIFGLMTEFVGWLGDFQKHNR